MKRYRTGGHHRITVIEYDTRELADREGRRPSDRLIGMVLTEADANRVVTALNDRSVVS